MSDKKERGLFNKQPGRILIIDLLSLSNCSSSDTICQALENVFSIICSLSGPNRVPCFGIIVIGKQLEVLLPLQQVKGNFVRIKTALNELKERLNKCSQILLSDTLFVSGIRDALKLCMKQLDSIKVGAGYNIQLELSVITSWLSKTLKKPVESIVESTSVTIIKKLNIITLISRICDNWKDIAESFTDGSISPSVDLCDNVDFCNITAELLPLQNYFSNWLLDSNNDTEHMVLIFDDNVKITCDLQERLLNPILLSPVTASYFGLSIDQHINKMSNMSVGKAFGLTMLVFQLQVICRVPLNAVCDSVTFGMPLIVKPSSCWKMEWEDLDNNAQLFYALCHELFEKNECLITQLNHEEMVKQSHASSKKKQLFPLKGVFILFPSPSCSMLLKSFACSELMLPVDVSSQEILSETAVSTISCAVNNVVKQDICNPYSLHSGLCEFLISQLTKSMCGTTPANALTDYLKMTDKPAISAKTATDADDFDTFYSNKLNKTKGRVNAQPAAGGITHGERNAMRGIFSRKTFSQRHDHEEVSYSKLNSFGYYNSAVTDLFPDEI